MADLKSCAKCKATLPLAEFGRDKHRSDGMTSRCRACRSIKRTSTPWEYAEPPTEKTCSACDRSKPASDFGKVKKRRHGLTARCLECLNSARTRSYPVSATESRCSACKAIKPASAFALHGMKRNGLNSWCKDCVNIRVRVARYGYKYGMGIGMLQSMITDQQSMCAGCLRPDQKLVVDHCHDTGEVRALLCTQCNTAEGMLRSAGHPLLDDFLAIMEKNLAELVWTRRG